MINYPSEDKINVINTRQNNIVAHINFMPLKPTSKLKLVLLPPNEAKDVTIDDVKYFYKNLVNILVSEN